MGRRPKKETAAANILTSLSPRNHNGMTVTTTATNTTPYSTTTAMSRSPSNSSTAPSPLSNHNTTASPAGGAAMMGIENQENSGNAKLDKKGRSTSCLLCQKRKQKCDHRFPSCTTCIRAGIECVKPSKYGVKPPAKDEYTVLLEKKIKFLEKILDKQLRNEQEYEKLVTKNAAVGNYKKVSQYISENFTPQSSATSTSGSLAEEQQQQQQQHPQQQQQQHQVPLQQQQQQKPPFLPLPPHSVPVTPLSPQVPQQHLVHTHSTIPGIPQKLHPPPPRLLPTISEFEKKHDRDSLKNLDFNLENDYKNSFISKYNLKEFLNNEPVYEIDENYSRQLLDIYFSRLQYKFPLLDEGEILRLHESYFNNDLQRLIKNGDFFHISFAKIWLIFAIAASLHMTTGRYNGPLPERFFCTGLRHLTKCKAFDDLSKIEILTLMVVYLTRTDRDSIGVFDIIGDAVKICIKLNLQKTATYAAEKDLKLKDRKMRVFWSSYIFEKTTAIAVSKKYLLPESMCDADLPLFEYEPSNAAHPINGPMFINQMIKIRRIEARFVETLNIISSRSKVTKEQLPLVSKFFEELDQWRRSCEGFSKGVENETLSTYYYRSVRVLIQPFLELLDPEDKLFKECQAAAGQICQLFKQFHQKTVFGHSTTHIHTVFVAGVTLIYCLWLTRNKDDMRRKQLGDVSKHTRPIVSEELFSGLDDLRACSICLYVMSERTKFALSFRDTFDGLMNATIGNLILRCGPDSSEIVYSNGPGMPPAIVRKPMHHFTLELSNKTDEEKLEEAARKKKQGQLQKSIPKSLSHLLIHSPPLQATNMEEQQNTQHSNNRNGSFNSTISSSTGNSNSSSATLGPVAAASAYTPNTVVDDDGLLKQNGLNFNGNGSNVVSDQNGTKFGGASNYGFYSNGNTSNIGQQQQQQQQQIYQQQIQSQQQQQNQQQQQQQLQQAALQLPSASLASATATTAGSEITPFNGRTTRMINNISTWTGESGQQINTGLLLNFSFNDLDDILLNGVNASITEEHVFTP